MRTKPASHGSVKREHPLSWISPVERQQIQDALARPVKFRKRTGRPFASLALLEGRIVHISARHERELVAAAYAEAARRRNG